MWNQFDIEDFGHNFESLTEAIEDDFPVIDNCGEILDAILQEGLRENGFGEGVLTDFTSSVSPLISGDDASRVFPESDIFDCLNEYSSETPTIVSPELATSNESSCDVYRFIPDSGISQKLLTHEHYSSPGFTDKFQPCNISPGFESASETSGSFSSHQSNNSSPGLSTESETLYSSSSSNSRESVSHSSSQGARKGRPSVTSASDSTELRLCHVCGNEAGRHNYYGGQVCNSCRAFFHRSVQNGNFNHFKCSKEERCDVNSRSWKSCQWCRFQKCLGCGMNASWVLNDSDRKARAEKRLETKKKRLDIIAAKVLTPKVRIVSERFTLEDEIYLRGLLSAFVDFGQTECLKFHARNLKAMDTVIDALYNGATLPLFAFLPMQKFITFKIVNFFNGMSDMANITERDRCRLVKHNYPAMIWFCKAAHINSHVNTRKKLMQIQAKVKTLGDDDYIRHVETKLEQLSLRPAPKLNVGYEQMFPKNWAMDQSVELRHRELTFKVEEWPRNAKKDGPDDVQMVILLLIILFSADFIELDNPQAVEKVQLKYAGMLSRYLKAKYKNGEVASKFCGAMTVSSMCREMVELVEKHRIKA